RARETCPSHRSAQRDASVVRAGAGSLPAARVFQTGKASKTLPCQGTERSYTTIALVLVEITMSHYKLLTGFVFLNLAAAGLGALVLRPVDKKPLPVLKGHHYWVNHVAFSPDGKLLASAAGMLDRAGEVTLWDMVSGEAKLHLELTPGTVYARAFSPRCSLPA